MNSGEKPTGELRVKTSKIEGAREIAGNVFPGLEDQRPASAEQSIIDTIASKKDPDDALEAVASSGEVSYQAALNETMNDPMYFDQEVIASHAVLNDARKQNADSLTSEVDTRINVLKNLIDVNIKTGAYNAGIIKKIGDNLIRDGVSKEAVNNVLDVYGIRLDELRYTNPLRVGGQIIQEKAALGENTQLPSRADIAKHQWLLALANAAYKLGPNDESDPDRVANVQAIATAARFNGVSQEELRSKFSEINGKLGKNAFATN